MRACRPVAISLVAGLLATVATFAGNTPTSLVVKSPFLPPQFNPPGDAGEAAAVPASNSQFEFRGVYQMNGTFYFHIHDNASRKGQWLSEDMPHPGNLSLHIVAYQMDRDILVIETGNGQVELPMKLQEDASAAHELAVNETEVQASPRGPGAAAPIRRPVIRSQVRLATDTASRRVTFQKQLSSN